MAQQSRTDAIRVAITIAIGLAVLNGAFFLLSYAYYKAHAISAPGVGMVLDRHALMHSRLNFVLCSGVIAAAIFAASLAPREVGHILALLLGLGALYSGAMAFRADMPAVMSVTLMIVGMLIPALAAFSWLGSRAAWAFLIAVCAVFGTTLLFGAPKVRGLLGVGLWIAMIPAGLKWVTVGALAMARSRYREAVASK